MGCNTAFATLALLAALLSAPLAAEEAPQAVWGEWRTPQGARIRLAPCGYDTALLCGLLVDTRAGSAAGRAVLTGLAAAGTDRWRGGQIRPPGQASVYAARLTLRDRRLLVEACSGLACGAEVWVRAAPAPAE